MRALDTNVLLRLIINDDLLQRAAAERVLAESIRTGEHLFVPLPALCELVWLLSRKFKQPKANIVGVIQSLVNWFQIDSKNLVVAALELYRQGNADFTDYLVGQLSAQAGCREAVTFDKALKNAPGFTIL